MPTFDFRCRSCSHVFEFERPFGVKAHPVCPACSSKKTEKILTPPAVHFKGTGFYKTDTRKAEETPKKIEKKKPEKQADPPSGNTCDSCPLTS